MISNGTNCRYCAFQLSEEHKHEIILFEPETDLNQI